MKTLVIIAGLGFAFAANASYREGTFHCKSSGGENTYTVQNVTVGGVTVPHVEAVLHYHQGLDPNSPIVESVVKGFAADSSTGTQSTLMLGALHLEFDNGELLNCKH